MIFVAAVMFAELNWIQFINVYYSDIYISALLTPGAAITYDLETKKVYPIIPSNIAPRNTSNQTNEALKDTQLLSIPKIVRQTYKTKDLPKNYDIWRKECMKINPGWEFKLWTDEDNEILIQNDFTHLYDLYMSYDVNIKRIDFARYVFLHQQGGVYMDMDFACLRPLNTILEGIHGQFVVASQYPKHNFKDIGFYANAFMATPPNHKILDTIFAEAPKHNIDIVLNATGPDFLTSVVRSFPQKVDTWTDLPFDVIYGYVWNTPKKDMCNSHDSCIAALPNAVTMNMWSHSWKRYGAEYKKWDSFIQENHLEETITSNITSKIE